MRVITRMMKKSPWRDLRTGRLREIAGGAAVRCNCTYDPRTHALVINPSCPVHGWAGGGSW